MFSINIFMFIKITEPFQHPLITVEILITLYLLLNKKTVQYTLKLAKNLYYDFQRSNHQENLCCIKLGLYEIKILDTNYI